MAKPIPLQVLTANMLRGGDVVYMTAAGSWSLCLADAAIYETPEAMAPAEAIAQQSVEANEVVNPYGFGVVVEAGETVPMSQRERIRAKGPTIREDLGKQAQAA